MDFFEHQAIARRKTGQMVVLFILAVITIVLLLNLGLAAIWLYAAAESHAPGQALNWQAELSNMPPAVWLSVSAVALMVIAGGSSYRILQLNGGGKAVAEMVGARLVSRHSKDPKERQLLNVVDEMAIASGVTVPRVYVMDDEPGINAFAAGYRPNEAIIAVTRGSLEQLERDEMQGVIAHEFSHILNGDMRINIRLIGVLHGILLIGMIGMYMLRSMSRSTHRSRDGKGAGAILAVGLLLMVVGYAGVFFGRLIKAGISRQREFLADASAVQFTRNPEGLTEAFKKIGKLDEGSLIQGEYAEDLSHMYFGESMKMAFSGWLATHPPLVERIKRINRGVVPPTSEARKRKRRMAAEQAAAESVAQPAAVSAGQAVQAEQVAGSIGSPGMLHMLYAAALLQEIPQPVSEALALENGSKALMFALVLDASEATREQELAVLAGTEHADLSAEVMRLATELTRLGDKFRLPLFDMAIPTLKALDTAQRQSLLRSVKAVIDADRKVKLNELTIYVLLKAHLDESAEQADKVRIKIMGYVKDEVALMLSLLAWLGRTEDQQPADIFKHAAEVLADELSGLDLQDPKTFDPQRIIDAMEKFAGLSPQLKQKLVNACIRAVLADDQTSSREFEVMRSLCATMDVPMPPVLSEADATDEPAP